MGRVATIRSALAAVCALLCLCAPLQAAAYYLDPAAGDDDASGAEAAPWRSWAHAQSQLAAGDVLYCTGELGAVAMSAADPAGTAAQPITYARWSGRPQPHVTTLAFDGTPRNFYLLFDGFRFDPGYVASAGFTENNAVNLDGARHVEFDRCDFEGPKLAGAEGDFAPYCIPDSQNPPAVTAGHPGNASYITIRNSAFGYASVAIRLVEHYAYPDHLARHWEIVDNDFAESAEDFITLAAGGGGDSLIARNTMHDQVTYRSAFHWPGEATGDWGIERRWAPVTQDNTGASAMFYDLSGGRLYLLADDRDHLPARNTADVWRLDADPQNVFFTPSATGDSTHVDCISIMGGTQNVLIERNRMELSPYAGQAMKLDFITDQPEYITVQNNLIFSRTAAATYPLLIAGGSNCTFRHNIIYPGPDAPLARGIRLLEKTGGAWVNLRFVNNIISGGVVSAGEAESDYNLWLSAPPDGFNAGGHTLVVSGIAAARLANPAESDFHLLEDSPACNAGDPAEAPGVSAEHPEGVDFDGLDRDAQPDVGPYEYRLRLAILRWESVAVHGAAGPVAMALSDQTVDPRETLSQLRIVFDRPLDPATVGAGAVTVVGQAAGELPLAAGDVTLADGNMALVVPLPAGLADDTWTIALSAAIAGAQGETVDGDRDLVLRRLCGDTQGNGTVGPGDVVAARDHSGQAITAETCHYDVDLSGRIDGADLQAIRALEGHALP